MYLGRIRSVRGISRDDRARIATCSFILTLWTLTSHCGYVPLTLASQRRHRHWLNGAVRSRSAPFDFAKYRGHKSLQSLWLSRPLVSEYLAFVTYAEIILQKLIIPMKERESKNENIAAVVDKFPKQRTTSRVSIDDCHWLSYRKNNESAFQWHLVFPGQVLVTETGSDNLYQIGPRKPLAGFLTHVCSSRYSGLQGSTGAMHKIALYNIGPRLNFNT